MNQQGRERVHEAHEQAWQVMQRAARHRIPGACVIEADQRSREEVFTSFSEYLQQQGCQIIAAAQSDRDSTEWPGTDEVEGVSEALSQLSTVERPLVLFVPHLELPMAGLEGYLRTARSRGSTYAVVGAASMGEQMPYTVFNPDVFPVHIDGSYNVRELN